MFKSKKKVIFLFIPILLIVIVTSYYWYNVKYISSLNAKDFFPKDKTTLHYTGGFENEGYLVDYYMNEGKLIGLQSDTGANVLFAYDLRENEVTEIFSQENLEQYNGEPNKNLTLLKSPLNKGTKWSNGEGSNTEISGIGVLVFTWSGIYFTVEVTTSTDSYVFKKYYAPKIGLVKTVFETPDGVKNISTLKKIGIS